MDRKGVGTFVNTEAELTSSSLDIFSLPPVDVVMKEGKTVYYHPLNNITENGPYEFVVPKDPESWTALPLTRLEGEIVYSRVDNAEIAATENLGIVNLLPQALFKQIECELNGVQVCDLSSATYPWKAYIETHLTYGYEAKTTHLLNSLYYKDTELKEDKADGGNAAAKNRLAKFQEKKFNFSIVLHSDFFHSQKYLLPNTEIKLKLIRSSNDFIFIAAEGSAGKYKMDFKNLKLAMRRIKIDPFALGGIEHKLKTQEANYDITQSKIKTINIPSGTKSIDFQAIYQGNLPRSIIFGILSNKSFNGTIDSNPFHFFHHNVNYFNLKINGSPVVPTPFTPDFEGGNYAREYRHFFDNLGMFHENETNWITKTEFMNNSCFWPFDLTPCPCNGFHNHEVKRGCLDLTLGFKTNIAETLYLFVYASFNSVIQIDSLRNITVLE